MSKQEKEPRRSLCDSNAGLGNLKIRILSPRPGREFPFGLLSKDDKDFIRASIGKEFFADRAGLNIYKLDGGVCVHIYDAIELHNVELRG